MPTRRDDPISFRVLVVDDNPAIHDDFRKILSPPPASTSRLQSLEEDLFGDAAAPEAASHGFLIDTACQGIDAIEMVRCAVAEGRPYAMAFVDVRMPPGIDGIETISRIWQLDPDVQAVICTAHSDYSWQDIVKSLGHTDGLLVLRKPFETIEAMQMAHALTRKWLLRDEVMRQLEQLESAVGRRTSELQHTNAMLQTEIARRSEAQQALRQLATHDTLTGLPNRVVLHDRLTQAIARAKRAGTHVAVMMLDLDHFKDVNDLYGHAAGDELLKTIASRLRASVRTHDTVTRMGGDEFVVVLEDLVSPADCGPIAQRMLHACSEPVTVFDHVVRTPPSIGIAFYPGDCVEPEALLKSADVAMYQAKEAGDGNYRCYAAEMSAKSHELLQLQEELGQALVRDEMSLWYQPIIDVTTGATVAMEALLRWKSPLLGQVPPMDFIPLAERNGMIVPIGTWVLRTACRQLGTWRRQGVGELCVSVNVSARQLHAPGFHELVISALAEGGIPASALEVEITETAALDEGATEVLQRLAKLGVRLSIDDFGSGYSSFARLRDLPIHTLKIDRSLVQNIAEDPRDAVIFKAIVTMAHSLGLSVVAEGIETAEQLALLRDDKSPAAVTQVCDRVQGFLLGRPLPVDAASTLLRRRSLPPPSHIEELRATG